MEEGSCALRWNQSIDRCVDVLDDEDSGCARTPPLHTHAHWFRRFHTRSNDSLLRSRNTSGQPNSRRVPAVARPQQAAVEAGPRSRRMAESESKVTERSRLKRLSRHRCSRSRFVRPWLVVPAWRRADYRPALYRLIEFASQPVVQRQSVGAFNILNIKRWIQFVRESLRHVQCHRPNSITQQEVGKRVPTSVARHARDVQRFENTKFSASAVRIGRG